MTGKISKQRFSLKRSILLIFSGLAVFILYLYFFIGFTDILEVLKEVDPVEYLLHYSLAIITILTSMLFYSMAWHGLLKILSVKIGLRESFIYNWIGIFVDLVIPFEAVTGEITRVYLASRNSKESVGKIVASIVSQRVLSTVIVLAGLMISSASLIFGYEVQWYVLDLLIAVELGTLALIILILYSSFRKEMTRRIVESLLKFLGYIFKGHLKVADMRRKVDNTLDSFYQGIELIRNQPKGLIKPIIFNFAAWFFHMATYILVFYALGFKISLDVSITVYSISVALQTIPVGLPVGVVEIMMSSLYNLFGIPLSISGTATALIRIVTFWFQIIIGYAIAQWIGIKALMQRT